MTAQPYTLTMLDMLRMVDQVNACIPKGGNERDVKSVLTIGLWHGFQRMLKIDPEKGEPGLRFYGTETHVLNIDGLGFACTARL